MKLFVFPSGGANPYSKNPYVKNMKDSLARYFYLIQPDTKLPRTFVLLSNSFKADGYILNWIEDSANGRGGFISALFAFLSLLIIKLRKAPIVWIFHNIHPHYGETKWSLIFRKFLFEHSSLIISHSVEALNFASKHSNCPVVFKNHPVKETKFDEWEGELKDCDFFYWSDIAPYKGVLEFITNPNCHLSSKKIYLLGKCNNELLSSQIQSASYGNVYFENRTADFNEICAQCKKAKYVIFPYIGDSISSSGVLMDTLLMGGIPLGPNKGAFADLADQGCCLTYNQIDEVFLLPTDEDQRIRLDPKAVRTFLDGNSWDAFGQWLYNILS